MQAICIAGAPWRAPPSRSRRAPQPSSAASGDQVPPSRCQGRPAAAAAGHRLTVHRGGKGQARDAPHVAARGRVAGSTAHRRRAS
eukprot:scaffold82519_cov37-Phaeocystis_antarctica.AAC.1